MLAAVTGASSRSSMPRVVSRIVESMDEVRSAAPFSPDFSLLLPSAFSPLPATAATRATAALAADLTALALLLTLRRHSRR